MDERKGQKKNLPVTEKNDNKIGLAKLCKN